MFEGYPPAREQTLQVCQMHFEAVRISLKAFQRRHQRQIGQAVEPALDAERGPYEQQKPSDDEETGTGRRRAQNRYPKAHAAESPLFLDCGAVGCEAPDAEPEESDEPDEPDESPALFSLAGFSAVVLSVDIPPVDFASPALSVDESPLPDSPEDLLAASAVFWSPEPLDFLESVT